MDNWELCARTSFMVLCSGHFVCSAPPDCRVRFFVDAPLVDGGGGPGDCYKEARVVDLLEASAEFIEVVLDIGGFGFRCTLCLQRHSKGWFLRVQPTGKRSSSSRHWHIAASLT